MTAVQSVYIAADSDRYHHLSRAPHGANLDVPSEAVEGDWIGSATDWMGAWRLAQGFLCLGVPGCGLRGSCAGRGCL